MKKFLPIFVSSLILLFPIAGLAGYVIHLKDGTKFVTDQYVEEGDQIKFRRYDGLIGIPKALISSIEQTGTDSGARATEPAVDEPAAHSGEKASEKRAETEKAEENPLQKLIEKKRILKKQLDGALARLREASKNKDAEAKKKAREEMRDYSRQIYALTEQAKETNNGQLPAGWWQD